MSRNLFSRRWTLVAAGIGLSSSSLAQAPFTEEAVARGIVHVTSTALEQMGSGVAFVDLDRDGDVDLFAVGGGASGKIGIWENDGTGHFTDRSAGAGLPNILDASAVSAADFDDDGDLDVHVSVYLLPDRLFRNDGGFAFTDIAPRAGVASNGAGLASGWGDYDGDTWPDLYVANRTRTMGNNVRNHLWRNRGDGTFGDVAEPLAVQDGDAPTLVMTWVDFDRDADADLYLGTDKGNVPEWLNRLYQNDGAGGFTDVTLASNTSADVHCMGIGVGDCDHNGFQDFYVTNIPEGNKLLMANGDGTFRDDTVLAGVGSYVVGWGAAFFDFDNDMTEDLYVCSMLGPDRFYWMGNGFPATELAGPLGIINPENSYCMALADIDNDGDLDLLTQGHAANLRLYINHEGELRNHLKLRVIGQGHNRDAIGAQVDLSAAGVMQMREVFAGSNFKSQNDFVLHFGMGAATVADQVQVTWPGGDSRILRDVSANQTLRLFPPEYLGDMNCDGVISVGDISGFVLALTDPAGYAVGYPNCQIDLADVSNDGVVSVGDIAGFVAKLTGA